MKKATKKRKKGKKKKPLGNSGMHVLKEKPPPPAIKKETSLTVPRVTKEILLDYMAGSGAANLSQIQKKLFIETAKGFNLNPLKREVYAIAYKNQFGGYDMSIITGYEVYLKRAERSGKLSGWKLWTEGIGAELKACINIHRKDFKEPVYHEVYLREYNTGKNLWVKKPITMIKKVAMAQGFRLAFPDELGGIPYTADELPENMTNIHPIKPPKTDKPKEPGMAETPNPEPVPLPARQAQELIIKVKWADMRKLNPLKFTKKYFDNVLEFIGGKTMNDLSDKELGLVIEEFEESYKTESERQAKKDGDKSKSN